MKPDLIKRFANEIEFTAAFVRVNCPNCGYQRNPAMGERLRRHKDEIEDTFALITCPDCGGGPNYCEECRGAGTIWSPIT